MIVRRAVGAARDVTTVTQRLSALGEPVGDQLTRWLNDETTGFVLLAERRGVTLGMMVVRALCEVGASETAAPAVAMVTALDAEDEDVREALVTAGETELEARGLRLAHAVEVKKETEERLDGSVSERSATEFIESNFTIEDGAVVCLRTINGMHDTVTLWSGGMDFRVRWQSDRRGSEWTVEGCVGTRDTGDREGTDTLHFDRGTGELREVILRRPRERRVSAEVLGALERLPVREGSLWWRSGDGFTLTSMQLGLYDTDLAVFIALRDEDTLSSLETQRVTEREMCAVALSREVALFLHGDRVIGWRVRDPVSWLRAMGWPESRDPRELSAARREKLTAVIYDWMTIDAGGVVRPDEAQCEEEIEHMVALRERARALSDVPSEARDDAAEVARDIAAHIHWSWGFFRVSGG